MHYDNKVLDLNKWKVIKNKKHLMGQIKRMQEVHEGVSEAGFHS